MTADGKNDRLNLIFDADDTLWDSNIHFLEAQAAFLETLGRAGLRDPAVIHTALRTHELAIIEEVGYGRRPYVMALHRVVDEIVHPELHDEVRPVVASIGERLLERHCDLLPGVEETLSELAGRHRLMLFTKGQPAEQIRKLERSGLQNFFARVGVPLEKDVVAYQRLLAQAELDPARTLMIGNSPRSDINPAIQAGLRGAVYVPHPHTWELEHEELLPDERIVVLTSFPQLCQLF